MILLDLIIVAPLVAAALCIAAGARRPLAPRGIALAGVLAQGALIAGVLAYGGTGGTRVVGAAFGVTKFWLLAFDGLSAPLLALTVVTGLLAVSSSWRVTERTGAHFALICLVQTGVSAVFLADSLVLFYVAWESVLIPMFLLIGGWGSARARAAATKFLIFSFAGGAVLLVGIVTALLAAQTDSISTIAGVGGASPVAGLLFGFLTLGMLVKLPAVPLHTWLPDAHTEAPTAGSILLAGVLLKMAGYGLIRVAIPLDPRGFDIGGPVLIALGLIGIVWGAATALVQSDLKRLVAYSSVAHMGFVLLAIGAGTVASLAAAVVTMVSHGLVAGLLFYLVGALYGRAHTRELARFGGLGTLSPRWASMFVFASLASAGLPGLSGFPGEFMSVLEGFKAFGWWMLVAGVGVVLAAAYNLRAVRSTVQGLPAEDHGLTDLDRREFGSSLLMGVLIIVLGLAPYLITAPAAQALESALHAVGR